MSYIWDIDSNQGKLEAGFAPKKVQYVHRPIQVAVLLVVNTVMDSGGGATPVAAESAGRSTWGAFFSALPKGQSLTDEVWILRHRVIVALVFAHAFALFLFGVIRGYETLHVALEISVLFVLGLVGRSER